MSVELDLTSRAAVHAALGDETRLAVVDALLLSDESPGVLADRFEVPRNLMAHHLAVLEAAGLVSRVTSEADRRRSYLRLHHEVLGGLLPSVEIDAARVLFVCTHNSARSQLAAALWRRHSGLPAASAGTEPASRVHPRALATAREHGIPMGRVRPRAVVDVLSESDLVVTVCDNAREQLDLDLQLRDDGLTMHWSIPDPAIPDTREAFESTFDTVAERVDQLASTVHYERN